MKRPVAAVLLVLVLLVLGHSVYSMFHGRFEESMVMLPVLLVCYVFFVARRKPEREMDEEAKDGEQGQDPPSSRKGEER